MDLHTWLDMQDGRATWLADQFGINKAAVSFWRTAGVPLDRMKRVEELTEGAVTVAAMVEHKMACAKPRAAAQQPSSSEPNAAAA